jgi:uncharacterized damage-inducible protein DinB
MNDDFVALYDYNRWADRRVIDACRQLTAERYGAEPAPGWTSVRSSLVHVAVVTDGWLLGLAGETGGAVATEADLPAVDDAARLLDRAAETFAALVPRLTPDWLATPLLLRRGTRSAVLPPWVVLRHVVNHATYHRGQIASKLKRLGIDPPVTDLVFWALEHFPQQG